MTVFTFIIIIYALFAIVCFAGMACIAYEAALRLKTKLLSQYKAAEISYALKSSGGSTVISWIMIVIISILPIINIIAFIGIIMSYSTIIDNIVDKIYKNAVNFIDNTK